MRGTDISGKAARLRKMPEEEIPEGLCEYLLVLSPPAPLWEDVMKIKKYFGDKYQAPLAIKTKPHITLVKFYSLATAKSSLIGSLERIARGLSPFRVVIDHFGSFPTHTIFLQVTTKEPVRQIVGAMKEARRLMKIKGYDPHFIDEPHLTICRKLLPWQYEQGWLEFSHLDFSRCFVVEELHLLYRPFDGKPRRYETAAHLQLKGIAPVIPVQTSLFDP